MSETGRAVDSESCSQGQAVPGGRVSFIGAGPGAADLITVRGARRIAEADIVVWAASLVAPECVLDHARAEAELIDSSRITHEQVLAIYRRAVREKLRVARVHSGDPALWGAVQEQYDACTRLGLDVEIVPGVSAFSAAAAAIGRELTVPEVAQSIVLTRLEGGKTPMPDGERIRDFARHGTTMAVFLSAARTGQLAEELRAGGYAEDTPVVVAYKVTWPDELLLYTTLGELEATVKQHKLWRHTLFLVGKALGAAGTRSKLYHAGHFHTYRKADPAARRALRTESSAASADGAEGSAATGAPVRRRGRSKRWSAAATRAGQVATQLPVDSSSDEAAADRHGQQDQQSPPGPSRAPASDVAWSAVHEWQETTRATGRTRSRSRAVARTARESSVSPSSSRVAPADQSELEFVRAEALGDTSAPAPVDPESAQPAAAEPVVAEPVVAEPVVAEPAGAPPVPAEPVVAASVAAEQADPSAVEDTPTSKPVNKPQAASKIGKAASSTGKAAPTGGKGRRGGSPGSRGQRTRRNG